MPTVSNRPARLATASLVPTPSVAAERYRPSPSEKRPENPPMPAATSGRPAAAARERIRSTARAFASKSTPASQ